MGQDGSWVTMGQWVMGQWVMGHVYDGSDGSWVTKSDPWSTLIRNYRPRRNAIRVYFQSKRVSPATNIQEYCNTDNTTFMIRQLVRYVCHTNKI